MTTNSPLAAAPARAPETKALQPRTAAPAIEDPGVATIVAKIDGQTTTLTNITNRITALEAKQSLAERRKRAIEAERAAADDEEREIVRGRRDPLTTERKNRTTDGIAAIEAELAETKRQLVIAQRKAARPAGPRLAGVPGGTGFSAKSRDFEIYRKAALAYLKYGQTEFDGVPLREIEKKALHGETGTDGGFLIHPEHDTGPLERLLAEVVPLRQHATVRTISAASLKKPVSIGGATASWVGEREARPETDTPDLVELEFPAHELYAFPKASQQVLEDASIDIESWIGEEVIEAFAVKEATAGISGTGSKQPQGLLVPLGSFVDEGSTAWTWGAGNVGFVKTGKNGGFADAGTAVNQGDKLWTLTSQLKNVYRQNGKFMLNRRTKGVVRTLKDGEGRWIWADARDGNPETLCGYEVIEAEQMPDIATNSYSMLFGDFRRAYVIVDRVGMSVLRDPYSAKPYIMFYTRKRVGGGIQNYEAYKALKFAA